ncbi:HAD family hydrolase [Synechococcus sp. PCC 7502]|uniref:HAD family hydrolase n=1 Tax=Synechococcus sp. PCC 7502 TaxID=1173263 RepID=UPI0002D647C4|nr:HAD family hydrolase [Synechococcus sp. PCC 7502]
MLNFQTSKLLEANRLLISDIDHTLLGDRIALKELIDYLQSSEIAFGVATGRSIESAKQILEEWEVPFPDLWITSVGSEIHYGEATQVDNDWGEHIHDQWQPELVCEAIAKLSGIKLQSAEGQRTHKISYLVDPTKSPSISEIQSHLRQHQLQVQAIYSHQEFLDILPLRASKGNAVSYCANKWNFSMEKILVAGDSGNDEQMLTSGANAVVVGNYSSELEKLRGRDQIYFANDKYAQGILEAIAHYKF